LGRRRVGPELLDLGFFHSHVLYWYEGKLSQTGDTCAVWVEEKAITML
jgi:hypothetical protein